MEYLTEADLSYFFKKYKNHYINRKGMIIKQLEREGVCTDLLFCTHHQGPFEVSIHTANDTIDSFAEGFGLKSLQAIDQLDYNSSWMRYLNGRAEITITPLELDIPFTFKIQHHKTIIYSLEKYFYHEVYEHLTMPAQFENYFEENESLHNNIIFRNW